MRALILAAGRGERLKPLTDEIPKPLIDVAGKPLIEHHLSKLAGAGFRQIVVNLAHLGEMIRESLGDGEKFGLQIAYSQEPEGALETGGGIQQALQWLGDNPFAVINGDIFTDYAFERLRAVKCDRAHLVLVSNPEHNPDGDFSLDGARIRNSGGHMHTFSGIAVYHPRLFRECEPGRYSVVPTLRSAISEHIVTGELHPGLWSGVGTPERLESIRLLAHSDF